MLIKFVFFLTIFYTPYSLPTCFLWLQWLHPLKNKHLLWLHQCDIGYIGDSGYISGYIFLVDNILFLLPKNVYVTNVTNVTTHFSI